MPYTNEELQSYDFFQNLREQDKRDYYDKISTAYGESVVSRSLSRPVRNSAGTFVSFEEEVDESMIGQVRNSPSEILVVGPPNTQSPPDHESTTVRYRNDVTLERIINRNINSLSIGGEALGLATIDPLPDEGEQTIQLQNGMIISDKDLSQRYLLANNRKRNFLNIEIFKSYEDILFTGGVVADDIPIIRIRLNDLNAIPNGANMPFYFSDLPETNQTGEQTSGGSTTGTQNSDDATTPEDIELQFDTAESRYADKDDGGMPSRAEGGRGY